jgi:hypothetical protein
MTNCEWCQCGFPRGGLFVKLSRFASDDENKFICAGCADDISNAQREWVELGAEPVKADKADSK